MQFVQRFWLEVFVEQKCLSHLKNTLNMVAMETKVCHVIKLWTSIQKKLNSRLLVQEEHGFQKGAQCAPLDAGAQKKPGLDRVKYRQYTAQFQTNPFLPYIELTGRYRLKWFWKTSNSRHQTGSCRVNSTLYQCYEQL